VSHRTASRLQETNSVDVHATIGPCRSHDEEISSGKPAPACHRRQILLGVVITDIEPFAKPSINIRSRTVRKPSLQQGSKLHVTMRGGWVRSPGTVQSRQVSLQKSASYKPSAIPSWPSHSGYSTKDRAPFCPAQSEPSHYADCTPKRRRR
jgi:hypothetical protein